MTGERGMDEMYLIPMQQQVQAARKELRECNEHSGRFGLALLGKDARSLRMGNAEQEELLYLLESKTLEQRRQLLRGAALKLCGELETGDAWRICHRVCRKPAAAAGRGALGRGHVQYLYCGERVKNKRRKTPAPPDKEALGGMLTGGESAGQSSFP